MEGLTFHSIESFCRGTALYTSQTQPIVNAGLECGRGMGIEDYSDWEVGDIVEAFSKRQKKPTPEEASASMTAALKVAGIEL
ncbi:hypothetical protein PVL29_026225 [Vitis rotundifolia]|uniref:Uncharacterized protein n=1 Tax=Vitis rotundifolia TaxID=103349 RepID=A0AA39D6G4_VITRO|nr:hypothetical protein PVL29_026225 [Vitis rotundifolia]